MGGLIRIWLLLVAATGVSAIIDVEWRSGGFAAAAILAVAALKIRFVVLDFMEVRNAPVALRCALEAWIYAIVLAIAGTMTFGPVLFGAG